MYRLLPKIKTSENPSLMIRYAAFLQSDRLPNLNPTVLLEAIEDLLRTALENVDNLLPSNTPCLTPFDVASLMRAISTGGHWHLLNTR